MIIKTTNILEDNCNDSDLLIKVGGMDSRDGFILLVMISKKYYLLLINEALLSTLSIMSIYLQSLHFYVFHDALTWLVNNIIIYQTNIK